MNATLRPRRLRPLWPVSDAAFAVTIKAAAIIRTPTRTLQPLVFPPAPANRQTIPHRVSCQSVAKAPVQNPRKSYDNAEVIKDGCQLSQNILTQAYTATTEPNVEVYWSENCSAGSNLLPGWFSYFTDMAAGACATGENNPSVFFVPYP